MTMFRPVHRTVQNGAYIYSSRAQVRLQLRMSPSAIVRSVSPSVIAFLWACVVLMTSQLVRQLARPGFRGNFKEHVTNVPQES